MALCDELEARLKERAGVKRERNPLERQKIFQNDCEIKKIWISTKARKIFYLFMREIRHHTVIGNRINPGKPDTLKLYDIPQLMFHQRLAYTLHIAALHP